MKAKVKLTYSVTLNVEGKDMDAIQDWLNSTTPMEVAEPNKYDYEEEYEEEIIRVLNDNAKVNLKIK